MRRPSITLVAGLLAGLLVGAIVPAALEACGGVIHVSGVEAGVHGP